MCTFRIEVQTLFGNLWGKTGTVETAYSDNGYSDQPLIWS